MKRFLVVPAVLAALVVAPMEGSAAVKCRESAKASSCSGGGGGGGQFGGGGGGGRRSEDKSSGRVRESGGSGGRFAGEGGGGGGSCVDGRCKGKRYR